MLDNITVFHSSIRIEGSKIVYFDPFKIEKESKDADLIFITHSHFDHYSPEDIKKILKDDTTIIAPASMNGEIQFSNVVYVAPEQEGEVQEIKYNTLRAYNIGKLFHPKKNDWLGYIVTVDEMSYYVAGDTDITEEARNVKCDCALLPCGGMYTMNVKEASDLANIIKPKYAIPTHYGSVAGSPQDGERFVSLLNEEIQGIIKIE